MPTLPTLQTLGVILPETPLSRAYTAQSDGTFYRATLAAQIASTLAGPLGLTDAQLLAAVPAGPFTRTSNWTEVAIRTVANALDAAGGDGAAYIGANRARIAEGATAVQQAIDVEADVSAAMQKRTAGPLGAMLAIAMIAAAIYTGGGSLGLWEGIGSATASGAGATVASATEAVTWGTAAATAGAAGSGTLVTDAALWSVLDAGAGASLVTQAAVTNILIDSAAVAGWGASVSGYDAATRLAENGLQKLLEQNAQARAQAAQAAVNHADATTQAAANAAAEADALPIAENVAGAQETAQAAAQAQVEAEAAIGSAAQAQAAADAPSIASEAQAAADTANAAIEADALPVIAPSAEAVLPASVPASGVSSVLAKIKAAMGPLPDIYKAYSTFSALYRVVTGANGATSYQLRNGQPVSYAQAGRYASDGVTPYMVDSGTPGVMANWSPILKQLTVPAIILAGAFILSR